MVETLFKKIDLDSFHNILYILAIIIILYSLTQSLKYFDIGLVFLFLGFGFNKFESIYHSNFIDYLKDIDIIVGICSISISVFIIFFNYFPEYIFFL